MSFILSKDKPFAYNPILSNENWINLDIQDVDQGYYDKLSILDKDKWYYKDVDIDYIHNEYGYRGDLISEIDTGDEYIVTFGCSYSYGYGLHYEDTYSYKVSKHYNCKNINLSVWGTGIGFHVNNTTLFLNYLLTNSKKLPKLVIYQYPSWTRMRLSTSRLENNKRLLNQTTVNWDEFDKDVTPFYKKYWILDETEADTESLISPIYLNNLWAGFGVPTFHMDLGDFKQKYKSEYQKFHIYNYSHFTENNTYKQEEDYLYELARDLSHNGRGFNDRVAKEIIKETK